MAEIRRFFEPKHLIPVDGQKSIHDHPGLPLFFRRKGEAAASSDKDCLDQLLVVLSRKFTARSIVLSLTI